MDLSELREEIDRIDTEVVRLLSERAAKALLAGDEKKKDGLPVFDEDRERIVLEKVSALNCGPLNDETVREIYQLLMNSCTELQKSAG